MTGERTRIQQASARTRLYTWSTTDGQGRERLSLYTALAGSKDARPETCPATLAPRWLAHLIPWIDQSASDATWSSMMNRFAAISERLALLPPAMEWRVKALCMAEATGSTADAEVKNSGELVETLCRDRASGQTVMTRRSKQRHCAPLSRT
jgi:hypothetical protein